MTASEVQDQHLDPATIARYLDGLLDPGQHSTADAHLTTCAECRTELVEVGRILEARPRRRWVQLAPLAAAAALLLLVWSGGSHRWSPDEMTRDSALTLTMAPRPVAPLGVTKSLEAFRWTSVPGALRYRVTLFAADGRALWQTVATDNQIGLPDSVRLVANTSYYWLVKAETDHGRWVQSELMSFSLTGAGRP